MNKNSVIQTNSKASPRDMDILWELKDTKKDYYKWEAELLKENALLKQKIELLEEEIINLKEWEEAQKYN